MSAYNTPPIPEHHKQWFEQLKLAAADDRLALMSCLDAETREPRTAICLVSDDNGEFLFTPVGHLSPADNPYDAYIPTMPETHA